MTCKAHFWFQICRKNLELIGSDVFSAAAAECGSVEWLRINRVRSCVAWTDWVF